MTVRSTAYGPWIRDMGLNAKAFDMDSDTFNGALVADAYTPDANLHDEWADVTNEVTGTNWPTGGVVLSTPTFTIASGYATFDAADVSEASTTVTAAEGMPIYDDTLTGDPLIGISDFTAAYSTSNGTFAVTWAALGIIRFKYDPAV